MQMLQKYDNETPFVHYSVLTIINSGAIWFYLLEYPSHLATHLITLKQMPNTTSFYG